MTPKRPAGFAVGLFLVFGTPLAVSVGWQAIVFWAVGLVLLCEVSLRFGLYEERSDA